MATYRRLIRCFTVSPDTLKDLEFSDLSKIGLANNKASVTLKTSIVAGRPSFPIGEVGIRFKTPAVSANRIVSFEFAQFDTLEPEDPNKSPSTVTDVRGRLHDGTTEKFWNGSAWVAITDPAADWNTLEDVSGNLPSWDAADPLGFVFELSTTSRTLAPTVRGVKVLYQADIASFHNDWLYTTLVAGMVDNIRPLADLVTDSDGTVSVALAPIEAALESAWDIIDIDAVFNEDTDAAHRTDLLASFDTGTRVITLAGAPSLGDKLLVRFSYKPVVAVTTSHDFAELGASPAILYEVVDWEDEGEASSSDNIVNVFPDPPVGVILPAPRRQHMAVTLTVTAPSSVNLRRLAETVTRFLQERRTIFSPTDGREAYLRIVDMFNASPLPDQTGLHSATMGFRLEDVYVWLREAVDTTGVRPGGLAILTDLGPAQVTTPVGGP